MSANTADSRLARALAQAGSIRATEIVAGPQGW